MYILNGENHLGMWIIQRVLPSGVQDVALARSEDYGRLIVDLLCKNEEASPTSVADPEVSDGAL